MKLSPFRYDAHRVYSFRVAVVCAVAASFSIEGALAAPAPAVQRGNLGGYEAIQLGRGHFNRLFLAATIEGTKGLLAVDTGASGTILSSGKFSSLLPGADRKLPPGVPTSAHVNGRQVPVGLARDFRVGHVDLGSLPLRIGPPAMFYDAPMLYDQGGVHQFDGLLGEDLLGHHNAVVDCGRLILYLSLDPARKMNLAPALTAAGWTRIPMTAAGKNFAVECKLGSRPCRLIVDTGSPFTALDGGRLLGAHIEAREIPFKGGIIGTRARQEGFAKLDTLPIGDYVAANVQVVSHPDLGSFLGNTSNTSAPLVGLLGGDTLAKNNAIIDVGGRNLYLKHAAADGKKP